MLSLEKLEEKPAKKLSKMWKNWEQPTAIRKNALSSKNAFATEEEEKNMFKTSTSFKLLVIVCQKGRKINHKPSSLFLKMCAIFYSLFALKRAEERLRALRSV